MNKKTKSRVIWLTVAIVLVVGVFFIVQNKNRPSELDQFAQCLRNNDVIFYGTFWCPHCQNQKKMFGRSARFLPYVECSTVDGRGQLPDCKKADISGYPTWEFADGERVSGEISLVRLSELSACELPS
ncbi:MAG: hypothetical protein ACOX0C_00655 [Patescibacteria group bacterium]|jgi:thiol-disulfide isomerase/thioredoxin